MSSARYILILILSTITLLNSASVACDSLTTQTWRIYSNKKWNYSIQYPSSWNFANVEPQYADGCTEWQSPDETAFIAVWVDPIDNRSLDEFADWYISENRRLNIIFYELVSNITITHHGLEAKDIRELFSPPLTVIYSCRTLIVSANGSYYSVIVRAPKTEYNSYVSVFDHVIDSLSFVD